MGRDRNLLRQVKPMPSWIYLLLLILLAFVLWVYVWLPIMVLRRYWFAWPVEVVPFDAHETLWGSELAEFTNTENSLLELGFRSLGGISTPNVVSSTTGTVTFYRNEPTGEMATICAILVDDPILVSKKYVEFNSSFADGSSIDTANVDDLPEFKRNKNQRVYRFGAIQDVQDLYHLHRFLTHRHHGHEKPVDKLQRDFGGNLDSFIEQSVFLYPLDQQVRAGRMRRTKEGYRLTVLGAFVTTYIKLFPIKQIRRWRADASAREIIRQWRNAELPSA